MAFMRNLPKGSFFLMGLILLGLLVYGYIFVEKAMR